MIIKTASIVSLLILTLFLIYKFTYLAIYYVAPIDKEREEKWINALNNQNVINIYKRTINEEDYLIEDNIKIKNDFENWERKVITYDLDNYEEIRYLKRENGNIVGGIHFNESNTTLLDVFLNEDYPADKDAKFTLADRKYFLLTNDINDEFDFLNYIKDNFYIRSNLFSNIRKIRENYGFNYFVINQIPLDTLESLTVLKDDYVGYIENSSMYRTVKIFREEKKYTIVLHGEEYATDKYIQDLLSTLEIK